MCDATNVELRTSADFIKNYYLFNFKNINQYHLQLQAKETTCIEAVEHYLQQINANNHFNAFTQVFSDEALQQAAALDKKITNGEPLKKLHGVVVAIKDVLCYKGHQVTAGSKILQNYVAVYNTTAVQRLLDEDAIIIGVCNCDEFAMGSTNENSYYGKVLNAIDETKVPGGSSGGSAVAVQAGMCMVSLGSDTGGSVRQPADFCGITGLKPSYGRISRYGLIAYASSFDVIGIFGKAISDLELMLSVMSGADEFDSTALQDPLPIANTKNEKKYTIGYYKQVLHHPSLDKEIAEQIFLLLEQLKAAGHEIKEMDFDLIDYVVPTYYVLTTAEASSNLSRFDGVRYGHRTTEDVKDLTDFYNQTRSEGFGTEVQRRIMLGTFVLSAGYYDAYYSKAQKIRRLLVDKTTSVFDSLDILIMPTSPFTAPAFGTLTSDPLAMYLADIYTVYANLTGIPGISIPLFKHSNNMPFGLQAMTKNEDELTLLQFSNMLMQQFKA